MTFYPNNEIEEDAMPDLEDIPANQDQEYYEAINGNYLINQTYNVRY